MDRQIGVSWGTPSTFTNAFYCAAYDAAEIEVDENLQSTPVLFVLSCSSILGPETLEADFLLCLSFRRWTFDAQDLFLLFQALKIQYKTIHDKHFVTFKIFTVISYGTHDTHFVSLILLVLL